MLQQPILEWTPDVLITQLPTISTSSSILFARGHALVQDVFRLPAPRCERLLLDTQSPTYNSRSLQLRQTNLQATFLSVNSHLPLRIPHT